MNKMILSMAIAAITFGGFAASAKDTDKTACPAVCDTQRPNCGEPQCQHHCLFDGINLTETQKEQLKSLHQDRAANAKAQKEAKREARNQNRREQLAKIKKILTPEQYLQFLENSYINGRHGVKGNKRHNGKAPQGMGMRHHNNAPAKQANR